MDQNDIMNLVQQHLINYTSFDRALKQSNYQFCNDKTRFYFIFMIFVMFLLATALGFICYTNNNIIHDLKYQTNNLVKLLQCQDKKINGLISLIGQHNHSKTNNSLSDYIYDRQGIRQLT